MWVCTLQVLVYGLHCAEVILPFLMPSGILQCSRPAHCMSTIANCKFSSCPVSQVEDAVDKAVEEELTKDLDVQRSSQAQASTSSRAGPGGGPRDAAGEVLVPAHSVATSHSGRRPAGQRVLWDAPGDRHGGCIIVPAAARRGLV